MVDQLESERVRQEVVGQQREVELRALKEQVTKLQEKVNSEASSNTPSSQDSQDTRTSAHPTSVKC